MFYLSILVDYICSLNLIFNITYTSKPLSLSNISTDMIAMKIMPIAIPRIRNKFECLPLFGELDDDVEVGEWCKGVFTGDAANVGAET